MIFQVKTAKQLFASELRTRLQLNKSSKLSVCLYQGRCVKKIIVDACRECSYSIAVTMIKFILILFWT